jgi:hypothetical protein
MFRGYSSSLRSPAVAEFDICYAFHAACGHPTPRWGGAESTYYRHHPKWGNVTFNFAFLPYIYPGKRMANYG